MSRNNNAQLLPRDGKRRGQVSNPFAIQLEGGGRGARQFKGRRAQPLHAMLGKFPPRDEAGRKPQQRRHVDARKRAGIQQPVAQIRAGKNVERPAVKFAVAEQHEFASNHFSIGANLDARLFFRHRLQAGDDIGERPRALFQFPTDEFNRPRIQPRAAKLHEVTLRRPAFVQKLRATQINFCFAAALQDLPRAFEPGGNFQLARKDIHRAERQHAEARALETVRLVADAVQDFVHRAVAARRRNNVIARGHRRLRKAARVAGAGRGLERALLRELAQKLFETPRLVAARSGVEDDADSHAQMISLPQRESRRKLAGNRVLATETSHAGFFFVSFAHRPRHNQFVIGAFLNALGILAGALFGLTARAPLSARTQNFFKLALGVFTVVFGLKLVVENLNGSFIAAGKQFALGLLAVVLGYWLGKILQLQKISNRIGRHAGMLLTAAQKNPPGKPIDGLLAGTILFCAAPLGVLGAVADGLAASGFFWLLLVKAVMDGLATASFVKLFRWPAALAAIPVCLFLNGLTFAVHYGAQPWLAAHALTASVNVAAGLVTCIVALVIFEVRRVELNSYLPAIFIAPLLKLFLG